MTPTRSDTLLATPYLDALAAPQPTPGGGSATAVTAAIGVSLLEMVALLSEQSAEEPNKSEPATVGDECQTIRRRFSELGTEDEQAYGGFRDALSLPKGTAEEKALRREALQQATISSAHAPLEIAELGLGTLRLIPRLATIASPYLRSDLATAAHLIASAIHGAIVMVDTNLGSIKDEPIRRELTARRDNAHEAVTEALTSALTSSYEGR
jgi:formiminotetrahydrofolate cyclodeaminase